MGLLDFSCASHSKLENKLSKAECNLGSNLYYKGHFKHSPSSLLEIVLFQHAVLSLE